MILLSSYELDVLKLINFYPQIWSLTLESSLFLERIRFYLSKNYAWIFYILFTLLVKLPKRVSFSIRKVLSLSEEGQALKTSWYYFSIESFIIQIFKVHIYLESIDKRALWYYGTTLFPFSLKKSAKSIQFILRRKKAPLSEL